MPEASSTESLIQVLGIAYSYQPSLAVRKKKTEHLTTHHSSQYRDFSYFFKSFPETIRGNGENLVLRRHPETNQPTDHWPEPELAILLGSEHNILAYTLANDFTAHEIEFEGRSTQFDGTDLGKCWPGSCALGPRWFSREEIDDDSNLEIGMRIVRGGNEVYNQTYNTSRHKHAFADIPSMLVGYAQTFQPSPPPSKKILLNANGMLPEGTVIMLGTGLIVREDLYSRPGDIITVYAPRLKHSELTNKVTAAPG